MKQRFKISMQVGNKQYPPWKIEDESGRTWYAKSLYCDVPSHAEHSESLTGYRGWFIAVGELQFREDTQTARIV